jgi:hypothetical protein
MYIIRKLSLLSFTFLVLQLCTSSAQANTTIKVWNHDIGPVKDGAFLQDQKDLNNVGGLGLFKLSKSDTYYPLFGLVPCFTIITKTGETIETLADGGNIKDPAGTKWHEFLSHFNDNEKTLGLPGTHMVFDLPVEQEDILCIIPHLKTTTFGFSSSAGCIYVMNSLMLTLTSGNVIMANDIDQNHSIDIVYSWSKSGPCREYLDHMTIETKYIKSYAAAYNLDNLDSDWKNTIDTDCSFHHTDKFTVDQNDRARQYDYRELGDAFRYLLGTL